MKVYLAEKTKAAKKKPISKTVSFWCVGHILSTKPQRSLEQTQAIQHKWDARKQRRILVENIQESNILATTKKL